MWESAKKGDAAVLISEISDMKTGQVTQVFQKNPVPEYEVGRVDMVWNSTVYVSGFSRGQQLLLTIL